MRLRLAELKEDEPKAQKMKNDQLGGENWQKIHRVLYYQRLSFVPKTIQIKLISRHYNDPLAGFFGIKKTSKRLA